MNNVSTEMRQHDAIAKVTEANTDDGRPKEDSMARIQSLEPTKADSKALLASEQKAIEEVIGKYIESGRIADSSIMKPVFHENAQMSGPAEDGAFSGPIQALYDYVDGNGPATDLEMRIVNMTISDERAASVVLHADHWHGKNFTDHFHLLKINGTWKILSKIYSQK